MRRALGITLGTVLFLALFVGTSWLTDDWDEFLPSLVRGLLLGAWIASTLALAIHHDVWGYGTLVHRREQKRKDRRHR
jgi:hypothetical protein